ncbi:MAG: methyltransferase [Paludibacteraceae bacterium]|nr:methyltransferase [Paludibacteraceae bacterium]
MSTPNFRFKQFTVWHDRCAMKVGTDGVLLGAWCDIEGLRVDNALIRLTVDNAQCTILDVGTGSGLIALMLAQRCPNAYIDAIDIAPEAVEQATYNFEQSPWADRLAAHLSPLQSWHPDSSTKYDLIVSNPPYFVDSLKNPDKGRGLARHTDTLSYEELLKHSARLLKEQGILALVLPAMAEEQIIRLAATQGLYPTRLTRVFSKPDSPTPIRILIEFCKEPPIAQEVSPLRGDLKMSSLYIESAHSPRSAEYAEMTKDFYL